MVAKLTDNEIRTLIPILKAEIAGYAKLENGMAREQDLRHQLFLDIQSGKTDPLDWLKQHSKHIIVPPGAIYQPACSREVSIKGWEYILEDPELNAKPTAVPTAIFTFGKDFPAINKNLLGDNITSESYNRFCENPYNTNDPSIDKMISFIKETSAFYTKNGFFLNWGMSSGTSVSFYHEEDKGWISSFLDMFNWTLLDPAYPDVLKQCRSNVMGPVIEISAEYKLLDKLYGSTDSSSSITGNTKNSLKKAGTTEDRYALIISSLLMARRDSEYPEGIEILPPLDFTPTTQEEKEMVKTFDKMREDALARKENIKIYDKFKAELDPILDDLQKYMGVQ